MNLFDIILVPMGWIMRLAYSLTNNSLVSILLFTLVMEILLIPFQIKQQKNQITQAKLAPKVNLIRKKYAGRNDQATQQKMNAEIMEMYQSEKFNPASGCGTLIIQLPILLCLYQVVTKPLRYICNVPNDQINSLITNFGFNANDQIGMIKTIAENKEMYLETAPALSDAVLPSFQVGPFDLSLTPTLNFDPFDWLMLIPILTFVVMILSQKIMQKFSYQSPETQAQQNSCSMKVMMWSMPLLSVYIEFSMSAAIGVYWVFRSIVSTIERVIIAKTMPFPKFSEEELKEFERQMNMSNKQIKKEAKKRSLHYIDADDEDIDPSLLYSADDDKKSDKKAENKVDEEEGTILNGETIDNKSAPAPIKNDEKSSYKNK